MHVVLLCVQGVFFAVLLSQGKERGVAHSAVTTQRHLAQKCNSCCNGWCQMHPEKNFVAADVWKLRLRILKAWAQAILSLLFLSLI